MLHTCPQQLCPLGSIMQHTASREWAEQAALLERNGMPECRVCTAQHLCFRRALKGLLRPHMTRQLIQPSWQWSSRATSGTLLMMMQPRPLSLLHACTHHTRRMLVHYAVPHKPGSTHHQANLPLIQQRLRWLPIADSCSGAVSLPQQPCWPVRQMYPCPPAQTKTY
jgi:hypothetical protein